MITTNRVLAQSLSKAIKAQPELRFEFHPLLNWEQAALDAEVLNIDVALVDVADGGDGELAAAKICETLRREAPGCRLLLLISQNYRAGRAMAIEAVRRREADDFVFYDTSLDYLFTKLSSI